MARKPNTEASKPAPARELTREEIEEKRAAHYAATRDCIEEPELPQVAPRKVATEGAKPGGPSVIVSDED